MSLELESIMTMSSFEALYALHEYRDKYPNCSDHELINILRKYPDKSSLDYRNAVHLEQIIDVNHRENILISLRNALRQIVIQKRPAWIYAITFGRDAVLSNLIEMPNIKQCLKSAHLLDSEPTPDVVTWWDELSQFIRAEQDTKKVQNGREGERLTFEYEKNRLLELDIKKTPKWIALEDNTAGYDIKSYELGPHGLLNKLIEVKSCSTNSMTIFLTRNEWENAKKYKDYYFFQIWHLPTNMLKYELSVKDMEPYVLQHKENTKWTTLEISLKDAI